MSSIGVEIKICAKCGGSDRFPGGLCRPCGLAYSKKRSERIKGLVRTCKKCGSSERTTQGSCKPCADASHARWRERNKAKRAEWDKRYREENTEKVAARGKAYRDANPFLMFLKDLTWRANNPDKARLRTMRWIKANPEKTVEYINARRARKIGRTPVWANKFFVQQAYDIARVRTQVTGVKWHVDHIVPLSSKLVCGLHVESNLSVITARANSSKGNRWWPDMWV